MTINTDELYLYEMDSEGNPIPETAQKIGDIKSVDISAEDTAIIQVDPNPVAGMWTEISDTDIAVEIEMGKLKNKQIHYDETHSRKSNWHKRYF